MPFIDLNCDVSHLVLWSCFNVVHCRIRDPGIGILLLAVMVITVMVKLISVILWVNVSLGVQISEHSSVSISIVNLNIVVEWDSAEWLEEVWVDSFSLWHWLNQLFLGFLSWWFCPSTIHGVETSSKEWVQHHMSWVWHSSKGREGVSSHLFNLLNN